jgi:hypothetical protein
MPIQRTPRPRSWLSLLRTARAAVAVLFFGAAGLSLPPQTRDMTEALSSAGAMVALNVALVALAVSAWFWSRAVLGARFGIADNDDARDSKLNGDDAVAVRLCYIGLPRVLFFVAALIGLFLVVQAWSLASVTLLVGWAAAGLLILRIRPKSAQVDPEEPGTYSISPYEWWRGVVTEAEAREERSSWYRLRLLRRMICSVAGGTCSRYRLLLHYAPFPDAVSRAVMWASFLVFFAGAADSFVPATWTWWPSLTGKLAVAFPGPAATVLLMALMIGPLTLCTFVADRVHFRLQVASLPIGLNRPPVLAALAIYVFVVVPTLCSIHTVRILDAEPLHRSTLDAVFGAWLAKCYPDNDKTPVYPVIVAVSGGATRAAIWADSVLHAVEDAASAGGPAVFAVSSVSGGSLGAAAYMSVLAGRKPPRGSCDAAGGLHRAANLGLDVLRPPTPLSGDALGPALAGWVGDMVPRAFFDPLAALVRRLSPGTVQPRGGDSAEAIEHAFERLWSLTAGPELPGFDQGFLSLFYSDGAWRDGMPIWIANGTDTTSGNRFLTVPFKSIDAAVDWPFSAAADVIGLLAADVPISTAINNTARFPILEPAGDLLPRNGKRSVGQLIDGGYFDNEGLQTALDLAAWLEHWGRRHLPTREVRPIIVVATADGEARTTSQQIVRCDLETDHPDIAAAPQNRPEQVLAPAQGLYDVRGGHMAVLLREAAHRYCGKQEERRFFHFYLPGIAGRDVSLNWILSDATSVAVWDAIGNAGVDNDKELGCMRATFLDLISPGPDTATASCRKIVQQNKSD